MQKIPESLLQRHQKWIDVVNAGDVDEYANLLVEDAVWIPPGQDPIIGRRAFREWVAPFLEEFSYEFAITDERIRVAGDWAIEKARFTSEMIPYRGGKPMKHMGTFTVLWNRGSDEIWYIERYIDDSDLSLS